MSIIFNNSNIGKDFSPIKFLLLLSIGGPSEYCSDSVIKNMVSDAKLLLEDINNIRVINRSIFDYTLHLENNGVDILNHISSPERITKEDCKKILEVFEK